MKFIRTIMALSFLLVGMICVSCSKDDDFNNDNEEIKTTPLTETEKNIVGGWPELGDNGVTFFKNGILSYDGVLGRWSYDEESKILTTNIVNSKKQVLIWQVTMLKDGSMAGIQIWDNKTFAAQRNVNQAIKDILFNQSWTRNKNGKLLVLDFYGDSEQIRYTYESSNDYFYVGYDDLTTSEQDLTSIIINSEEYGKHIIHNPYDHNNIYFEFPNGLKYYPITEDMAYVEEVKMSKQESMLVGKWICKEQIWNKNASRKLYFDDEYGMEFSDGYWGEMWSGTDQLMEVMNTEHFSWFIKENKLYRDNDCYYILKLTDKEMELEWRDNNLIITCKFYKYDENEGLLIDQLEYVDLGLSVKWATRNLGTENKNASPLGDYYAWGETSAKKVYTPDNYKYCKNDVGSYLYLLTKYCSDPHNGYNGFIDNKTTLDSEDDAATAIRGKEWRMPTIEEFQELVDKCTWVWTQDTKGNYGYKVTGKTGYYIFLPAAGYKREYTVDSQYNGFYLTNSTGNSFVADFPIITFALLRSNSNPKTEDYLSMSSRTFGYSIRPVHN